MLQVIAATLSALSFTVAMLANNGVELVCDRADGICTADNQPSHVIAFNAKNTGTAVAALHHALVPVGDRYISNFLLDFLDSTLLPAPLGGFTWTNPEGEVLRISGDRIHPGSGLAMDVTSWPAHSAIRDIVSGTLYQYANGRLVRAEFSGEVIEISRNGCNERVRRYSSGKATSTYSAVRGSNGRVTRLACGERQYDLVYDERNQLISVCMAVEPSLRGHIKNPEEIKLVYVNGLCISITQDGRSLKYSWGWPRYTGSSMVPYAAIPALTEDENFKYDVREVFPRRAIRASSKDGGRVVEWITHISQ